MQRVSLLLTLLALAVLPGALTACGGDAGSGEAPPAEIGAADREELLAVADRKVAEDHPGDGRIDPATAEITGGLIMRLRGTATKTGAIWDMTFVGGGDEPYEVQAAQRDGG